ncbi:FtsK/SpoIIIE domain-containing protein [Microbacterium halophytorum]|uniref:FtsK/SpoIIIE domain-containing protein n=1 Tax=Microbacterium halophytorum TaxID=2067568 RepID=UPI000CFA9143|nr:FtsK/SpoIIIE domain-containing protein [Microbacterium halophytorum]
MKVKLTLHRDAADPVDVVVTADSTATVGDVARHIAESDPARTIRAEDGDVVTLAVAPPTAERMEPLQPDIPISEAPIGSGFAASVHNLGPVGTALFEGRATVAMLRAVDGPLAGQDFAVPRGHSFIGRAADNDIVLPDGMVSKRHARLEVSTFVELVDLNSANGISVDGEQVQRVRLEPGRPFVIGGSTLVLQFSADFDAFAHDPVLERGGGLLFNRSPRVEVRYPGEQHPPPRIPGETLSKLFPWALLVAPIITAFAIYLMTERPRALLLIVMTPLMAFANYINQRKQQNNKYGHEQMLFERQFEKLEETFYLEKPREEQARREEVPPVAEVFEHAMRLGPLLWTRRPEHWNFLAVRLGTSTAPSRNSIREQEEQDGLPQYIDRIDRLRERYADVHDVPVVETFAAAGSIGVAGPMSTAADAMRGIAVQAFGLHAPNEVVTVAFSDSAWVPELEWMKWLPHTSSEMSPFKDLALADSAPTANALLSSLEEYVMRLVKDPSNRGPFDELWNPMLYGTDVERAAGEHDARKRLSVVVVVTNDAPVDRARLTQVLELGAEVGVHAVFVSPTVESLPATCRSFVDVTAGLERATVGIVRTGQTYEAQVEGVSNAYMHMFAKRLAPVVDASTVVHDESDIPGSVSLLALVGAEVAEEPASIIERWHRNNSVIDRSGEPRPRLKKAGNLRAVVGQGASDAMTLDLRSQGPHALVGGTTGAGKSEFLQAWVLGMASAHSPDRVTFLFVDYKGGSAFADCVDLPHCVGLVTDLSPHLVRRALTSLRAELHYREHLFNRKKAKDLLELEKRQDPETPPALVLVIDEFAALAGEVPEFVDGVVDIAQRGRSLGIHLIMATQRPAGVIKDNLRANTNLRVALRMADESDSKDVVDDEIAASFPPSLPGRAIAKTGPGRLTPFQSAFAGGWTRTDEVTTADVTAAELRFGSITPWQPERPAESEAHDEDLGPNDQKRIVGTIIAAAERAHLPAPRRPWLDDLAPVIDLEEITAGGDSRIALGLADLPERQEQTPTFFEPDRDGSLLVFGTSGSGKSTILKSIATAAGMEPESGPARVYALDFASGALGVLESLPHVGSVIDSDDTERIQRLLLTLSRELDRRSEAFAAAHASTLSEYRQRVDPSMPRVFLLIDNFAEFKKDWETLTARAGFYRAFLRILGEGRPLGVHAVITADRSGAVPTAVASNISRRIILRLSDANQYLMLGAPKDSLGDQSPPGRAVIDKTDVQLGVLGGTTNTAEQSKRAKELGDELRARGAVEAPAIGALPTKVDCREMPATVDGRPVFGVADDTLEPRGFDPVGPFIVTGPPASGKTNAMKSLIIAMERFDPEVKLFHFGTRRSELADFRPWVRSATKAEDEKALAVELTELVTDESIPFRILIVCEDVPHLADGDTDRPMRALIKAVADSDHMLIGDADVARAGGGSGVMGLWKSARQGIALKPDGYDGDSLFKVPFGRIKRADFPVGRGMFVQAGRAVLMQMPVAHNDRPEPTGEPFTLPERAPDPQPDAPTNATEADERAARRARREARARARAAAEQAAPDAEAVAGVTIAEPAERVALEPTPEMSPEEARAARRARRQARLDAARRAEEVE